MNSQKQRIRILIAGGGTGGHLFPGLAVAQALKQEIGAEVRFVGTKRGLESRLLPSMGIRLYTLPISGLYRVGAIKKMLALLKLPLALLKSFLILLSFRPHLVIGVGGYASGPLLLVAILLRRNTAIQEQNAYPGMTNRLLGPWTDLAFVPFKGLEKLFRHCVVTGNPIRKELIEMARQEPTQEDGPFTLSIIGGSQGAHVLNQCVKDMLPRLKEMDMPLRIVHQTGKADYEQIVKAYQDNGLDSSQVAPFIDDMAGTLKNSHLLLSRAGSMINEIIAMGRASLLVPIPASSGDHQRQNALRMTEAKAAIMIEQKDLNPDLLLKTLVGLMKHPEQIKAMEKSARGLFSGDAAQKIAQEAIRYFKLDA